MPDLQEECISLSNEILKNIELSELPNSKILLKCLRLCRLLKDEIGVKIFTCETSGYKKTANGIFQQDFEIGRKMGRVSQYKDTKGNVSEHMQTELLQEIEETIEANKLLITSSKDPSVNITSANPNQYVSLPFGNKNERSKAVSVIKNLTKTYNIVCGKVYDYILQINYKLKFNGIIENIIHANNKAVNEKLSSIVPDSSKKFISVYSNLQTNNEEDWANAVHSCRRIIKDVADVVCPPTNEKIKRGDKTISLTDDKVINRLMVFIEDKISSDTTKQIIGKNLEYIGDRLDAIFSATSKGTHSKISKYEAERFVTYTYFILGDIVSLID
jgi:hypothetical protein